MWKLTVTKYQTPDFRNNINQFKDKNVSLNISSPYILSTSYNISKTTDKLGFFHEHSHKEVHRLNFLRVGWAKHPLGVSITSFKNILFPPKTELRISKLSICAAFRKDRVFFCMAVTNEFCFKPETPTSNKKAFFDWNTTVVVKSAQCCKVVFFFLPNYLEASLMLTFKSADESTDTEHI